MPQQNDQGEVVLYRRPGGHTILEVRLAGDSIWLTQSQIAKLFGVNVPAISKHISNIYKTRELQPKSTVSKMEIVRKEGKRQVTRLVDLYSLDMIISVGYRVNSTRATQFRIWATRTLRDHLLRGYTLNEKRLRERDSVRSSKPSICSAGREAECARRGRRAGSIGGRAAVHPRLAVVAPI